VDHLAPGLEFPEEHAISQAAVESLIRIEQRGMTLQNGDKSPQVSLKLNELRFPAPVAIYRFVLVPQQYP
jgi:hypothetical protein